MKLAPLFPKLQSWIRHHIYIYIYMFIYVFVFPRTEIVISFQHRLIVLYFIIEWFILLCFVTERLNHSDKILTRKLRRCHEFPENDRRLARWPHFSEYHLWSFILPSTDTRRPAPKENNSFIASMILFLLYEIIIVI